MEELPYNGNLQEAIRAGDRNAIRTIMEHRTRFNEPSVSIEEESPLPEKAQVCVNTEDYISNDRWSNESDNINEPDIFIRYMDFDESVTGYFCYKKDDLITLSDTREHAWIIPSDKNGLYFDDDGKIRSDNDEEYIGYGEPSIVEKFVKIPPSYYIWYHNFVEVINNSDHLIAVPLYKTRLGSPNDDAYSPSTSHGQGPDTTVYYLVDENLYRTNPNAIYSNIYDDIYKAKTGYNRDSLWAINELQNTYRQSIQDNEHYWNGLRMSSDQSVNSFQDYEPDYDSGYEDYYEPGEDYYSLNDNGDDHDDQSYEVEWEVEPTGMLTVKKIYRTMVNRITKYYYNNTLYGEFFGKLYNAYLNGMVIDSDRLVSKDDPVGDYRWETIEMALSDIQTCIYLYNTDVIFRNEVDGFDSNMIMSNMINYIDDTLKSNLKLYINTSQYVYLGPTVDNFGDYLIPEVVNPIYDVIICEIFINNDYDKYVHIKSWNDFITNNISFSDVINKILGTPSLSNSILTRLYFRSIVYDNLIFHIYNASELIFQNGYYMNIDLYIANQSDDNEYFNTIKEFIESCDEINILISMLNNRKFEHLIEYIKDKQFSISRFIRDRLDEIMLTESVIFKSGNMYKFEGTAPLIENAPSDHYNHQNPYIIGSDQLDLMYYLDPAFKNLIGQYQFTEDDRQNFIMTITDFGLTQNT